MPTQAEIDAFNAEFTNKIQAVVRLIYMPGCPVTYTGNDDIHQKELVTWGEHKRAMIDMRLRNLIRQLWRAGCETVGCCEDVDGNAAYIQFLSRFQGGDGFVAILNHHQIQHATEVLPYDMALGGADTQWGMLRLNTFSVRFPRNTIEGLADAIEAKNTADGKPVDPPG